MTDSPPPRPGETRAALMFVLVTFFWGLSFPLMKDLLADGAGCPGGVPVAGLTVITLRVLLALTLFAAVRPRLTFGASRRELLGGAGIGVVFAAALGLQVVGLARTTPALSALFTSLGTVWVLLIGWTLLGHPVRIVTAVGAGLAVSGAAVLAGFDGGLPALGPGEWLTVAASLLFAVQIILLDRLGKRIRPEFLTAGFFLGTGLTLAAVVALLVVPNDPAAWSAWLAETLHQPSAVARLVVLTVFSTGLTFHWMNVYQPQLPPERAALLYLLEPVFAGLLSLLWGHDRLTASLAGGAALILAGNILVEGPALFRVRSR